MQLEAANQIDGYVVTVDTTAGVKLIVENANGFRRLGSGGAGSVNGLQHQVVSAATIKRTTTANNGAATPSLINFAAASIALSGTGVSTADKWVLTINGIATGEITGASLNAVAEALETALKALIDSANPACDALNEITVTPDAADSTIEIGTTGAAFTLAISTGKQSEGHRKHQRHAVRAAACQQHGSDRGDQLEQPQHHAGGYRPYQGWTLVPEGRRTAIHLHGRCQR